jgi:FkbM family methyltransferase
VAQRRFVNNEMRFGDLRFLMESIINSWGEDDQVVASAAKSSWDENVSCTIWTRLVAAAPAESVVLDIGAYTGLYSLLTAATRADVRSIAFEPSTITFGRLSRNILLNDLDMQVFPANVAAGSKPGVVTFPHVYGVFTLSSGESLNTQAYDHTQIASLVSPDSLLGDLGQTPYFNSVSACFKPLGQIVAIKIDVEGAELDVLAGARDVISRDEPVILAEYLSLDQFKALEAFAGTVGYVVLDLAPERNVLMFPAKRTDLPDLVKSCRHSPLALVAVR